MSTDTTEWKWEGKNIYVCIFINVALLCNKANYNVLSKLPDSCTKLPLSIIAII